MSSRYRDGRVVGPVIEPATRVDGLAHQLLGLTRLAELLLMSRARGEEPSERAVLPADLRPFGLSLDDLRELVTRGLVTAIPTGRMPHGDCSKTRSASRGAKRRTSTPPVIGARTPFILTDAGLAFVTKHSALAATPEPSPDGRGQGEGAIEPSPFGRGQGEGTSPTTKSSNPATPPASFPPSPLLHYDIESRELSVAGIVILRLRLQAHNLTAVLTALQLAGWPPRVRKPLNGYPDASDPQHLADAVYGLNHRQSLIEFRTDGSAIRWQWRTAQDNDRRAKVSAVARQRR